MLNKNQPQNPIVQAYQQSLSGGGNTPPQQPPVNMQQQPQQGSNPIVDAYNLSQQPQAKNKPHGFFREAGPQEGTMLNKKYTKKGRSIHGGQKGPIKELIGGISDIGRSLGQRGRNIGETIRSAKGQEQGAESTNLQVVGQLAGMLTDTVGNVVGTGLEVVTPEFLERPVSKTVNKAVGGVVNSKVGGHVQDWFTELEQENPEAYRNLMATMPIAELGFEVVTGGAGAPALAAARKTMMTSVRKAVTSSVDNAIVKAGVGAGDDVVWNSLSGAKKQMIKRGVVDDSYLKRFQPHIEKSIADEAIERGAALLSKAAARTKDNRLTRFVEEYGGRHLKDAGGDTDAVYQDVLRNVIIDPQDAINNGGRMNTRQVVKRTKETAQDILKGIDKLVDEDMGLSNIDDVLRTLDESVNNLKNTSKSLGAERSGLSTSAKKQIIADLKDMGLKVDDLGNLSVGQQIQTKKLYQLYNNYRSTKTPVEEALRKTYKEAFLKSLDDGVLPGTKTSRREVIEQSINQYGKMTDANKVLSQLGGKKLSSTGLSTTLGLLGGMSMAGFGFNPLLYFVGNGMARFGYDKLVNFMAKRLETGGSLRERILMQQKNLDDLQSLAGEVGKRNLNRRALPAGPARPDRGNPNMAPQQSTIYSEGAKAPVPSEPRAGTIFDRGRGEAVEQNIRQRNVDELPGRLNEASSNANTKKVAAKATDDLKTELDDMNQSLKDTRYEKKALKKDSLNSDSRNTLKEVVAEEKKILSDIELLKKALKRIKQNPGQAAEIAGEFTPDPLLESIIN